MLKKFNFILFMLCLTCSLGATPLIAFSTSSPLKPTQSSTCKPCKCQFKRLIAAMHELKNTGTMTEQEYRKAFDALMKIPQETFKDVKDIDQKAADTLYKAKSLTEEQYKKICSFLKNNPPYAMSNR